MFKNTVNKALSNPRRLFLIDGLGAILSVFLLGVVLVRLESVFGIPHQALYLLASFPCVFIIFDIYCYLRNDKKPDVLLQTIAYINLLYCFLSIGVAFYHIHKITHLGWVYILLEILIVIAIATLELKAAIKIKAQKPS